MPLVDMHRVRGDRKRERESVCVCVCVCVCVLGNRVAMVLVCKS